MEKCMPKISVIVPIYNVEKYLQQCIESIKAQTFWDYEVLLIDDGSTDDSFRLAGELTAGDERFTLYHKENGGQSDARNFGLDRCRGEYICFVDSDDWLENTYLEELYALAVRENADIVRCAYFKNSGSQVGLQPETESIRSETGIEAIGRIYTAEYVDYVVPWNKLYRGSIFEGLRYEKGIIHEDEAICAQVLYRAALVVSTDRILYNYRIDNEESTMGGGYSLKHLDMLRALEIRMDFYKAHGLKEYYEKDSFKYLYKILLNIVDIRTLEGDHRELIKELKTKYWNKYEESKDFDWSLKRRIGMKFFGHFPKAYLLRYKKA